MLTDQRLRHQGHWFFKYRSFLPLTFLALALASLYRFQYPFGSAAVDLGWDIFCLLVGFLGFFIRACTVAHTPPKTSGRNRDEQVAEKLNTTGSYSLLRNPLYLGNFFMWGAVTLATQSVWVNLLFVLAFALFYERIILVEEEFLLQKFGQSYSQWAAKTPAFYPRFSGWVPNAFPANWKKMIREEYRGLCSLILALGVVEVVSEFVVNKRFTPLDPFWKVLLVTTFAVFVVLRLLTKLTSALDDKVEVD